MMLALHAPGGVAGEEGGDFFARNVVEIALNRVLEATGGDGEGDRSAWLLEISAVQRVEQAGGKRIAGTDAIDDVADFVGLIFAGGTERSEMWLAAASIIKQSAPVVVVGGVAFAKGNRDAGDIGE